MPRLDRELAVQILYGLLQYTHGDDINAGDDARLLDILHRNNDRSQPHAPHLHHHRQDAMGRAHLAGERQLADEAVFVEMAVPDLSRRAQQSHGDRQVVDRALLPDVRRREIDRDVVLLLKRQSLALERLRNPVLRLLDRRVGQADDRELRSADLRVHLDLHHPRVNPVDRSAITLCQHFVRTFLSLEDANIIAIIDEKRIEPNSRQPQDFSRLA